MKSRSLEDQGTSRETQDANTTTHSPLCEEEGSPATTTLVIITPNHHVISVQGRPLGVVTVLTPTHDALSVPHHLRQ